jgi:hypothetical protein
VSGQVRLVWVLVLMAIVSLLLVGCTDSSTSGPPDDSLPGDPAKPPNDEAASSLQLREVLGEGLGKGGGCWEGQALGRGPSATRQPTGFCRLDQLRLGDPLTLHRLADVGVEAPQVEWMVRVELVESDWSRLERFTATLAARHAFVAFIADGDVLATALVRHRATQGTLAIQRDYTREQALEVEQRLDALVVGTG